MKTDTQLVLPDILKQGDFSWGAVSETGMTFKPDVDETEWQNITQQLCNLFEFTDKTHSHVAMMLGDALRYGEDRFGEKFANVIDATREYMRVRGIDRVKNWQWVAGKIAPERRRINLSFAHHELVAPLDPVEQDEFLDLAESEAMKVRELRKVIRDRHPSKPRKGAKAKEKVDTEKSALQKLIDVSNFVSEQGKDFPAEAKTAKLWKGPMEKLYKLFRRKWMSGHKR